MKKILWWIVVIVVVLGILFMTGPFVVLFGAPVISGLGIIGCLLWATGVFKKKE